MILSNYICGTIFIDDKKEDVENLIQYFEIYNIWSKFINPNDFDGKANYNYAGARLVFLDLQYTLSGTAEITRAVNILRQLSNSGVKNFILVVWSMHSDEIDELKDCIDQKMEINRPLIILNADKEHCINIDFENFSKKMDNLFEKSLIQYPLVYRMLEWEKCILYASRDTFNELVALSYDENQKTFNLNKVLFEMSQSSANDAKMKSSFSYMHDLLSDNIIKYSNRIDDCVLKQNLEYDELLKLKLNTLQMIKKDNLEKENPGDVYLCDSTEKWKQLFVKDLKCNDIVNIDNIEKILLDITPPCTFLKSDTSIMVEGIIVSSYDDKIKKKLRNNIKQNFSVHYYYDDGCKKILILNFLKVKYRKKRIKLKKLFCLKSGFRSSIQQQFGSFLTRIGDNIIHIEK